MIVVIFLVLLVLLIVIVMLEFWLMFKDIMFMIDFKLIDLFLYFKLIFELNLFVVCINKVVGCVWIFVFVIMWNFFFFI